MSRVRHPNVIQIYQLIFTEEHYCFVVERPESCKDFFDVIQDRNSAGNPLSEKEVRRYITQILEANIRCEEKGVVLRDIKPENILLDLTNDEVKLIDFGLASEIQEESFDSFKVSAEVEQKFLMVTVLTILWANLAVGHLTMGLVVQLQIYWSANDPSVTVKVTVKLTFKVTLTE
ncbi:serine/threonine-protein kinase pim-2-like [Stylophora pistillata]|uniref:serine/threonine-protein kinase pim-2-like n=1 Tax=Stylophora pistillata TaxID=50429 RepID=UPI000C04F785|nr:serine/threonine-protein kinase pim-2-like [Stylophora pistillata]